jgi:hypothetical protein
MMNSLEIPFSKWKLLLTVVASTLFVVVGVFLLFVWSEEAGSSNSLAKKIIGGILIVFFGAVGVFGLLKIILNKSALVINDEGILDNTTASSFGLIKWENITGFKIEEMMSRNYLVIQVNNGEEMIEKSKGMVRKTMKMNFSMYLTPYAIPSTVINYKLVDLIKLLEKQLSERQKVN